MVQTFISAGSGGLNLPDTVLFTPTGQAYVSSLGSNEIKRYDGTSGAFLGNLVNAGGGGLNHPASIVFAPDGTLLASSYGSNEVKRYDATTGAFLGNFIGAGNGLDGPGALLVSNNQLLVSSFNNGRILRYDVSTGNYLSTFELGHGLTQPALFAVLPISAVPEPSSMLLLGIGTIGAYVIRHRRFKRLPQK